jgi:DNA replication and repair protein RecF
MSTLSELRIGGVRNISQASLACHPKLNVLHGENGSGKTSILESIFLLSRGKSFRTSHTDSLINYEEKEAVVFAALSSGKKIGLSRGRAGKSQLKLSDSVQKNWDEVAHLLPILAIDSTTFQLLEGGPKARRQFLDWGVFHVEHTFISHWRRFKKALANRNQLLKSGDFAADELDAWTRHVSESGEAMHQLRSTYFARLLPVFYHVYESIKPQGVGELAIAYQRGWAEDISLSQAMSASLSADRRYKATQVGPHRADLLIKSDQKLASEVLSRGQQKLVVSAMKIAQGVLHSSVTESPCIYLVDDLPAELDERNRALVLECLLNTDSQLFVTCVERESLAIQGNEFTAFHVERGKISES